MELCRIQIHFGFTFNLPLKFMEQPTNCILLTGKMSIVLSHDNANLKTFAFITNLGIEILIVPSHRTHRLQELDVIAFGLWDDLEESRTKEAKIRNTE